MCGMARLIALVALLLAVGAAPAAAEEVTKTDGSTVATLSWTQPADGGGNALGLRLVIMRDGAPVFDGNPGVENCDSAVSLCAVESFNGGPLNVDDVDGDGVPDVLVRLFTGGAHCCSVWKAFLADGSTAGYDFRDISARLRDLDGDGVPEFQTADAGFAYAFASFASSGFPIKVLRLRDGAFRDVTRRFPKLVRKNARTYLSQYRRSLRAKQSEPQGPLAAWVADQYTLGKGASARAFLRRELANGHLKHGIGPVKGKAFLRALDKTLRRLDYR
jgi:hypothetical protein